MCFQTVKESWKLPHILFHPQGVTIHYPSHYFSLLLKCCPVLENLILTVNDRGYIVCPFTLVKHFLKLGSHVLFQYQRNKDFFGTEGTMLVVLYHPFLAVLPICKFPSSKFLVLETPATEIDPFFLGLFLLFYLLTVQMKLVISILNSCISLSKWIVKEFQYIEDI